MFSGRFDILLTRGGYVVCRFETIAEFWTMRAGFCICTPSVPRASILWLAHAVKVVRPAARRLHLDRVRFAMGWHLGITLGVCMSGFRIHGQFQTI
jgi:hypothetical protein